MSTSEGFEVNAEAYTRNSEIQLNLADLLLERYSFKKNAHVLDIGCGDGRITSNISKRVPEGKVVGVDIAENVIQFAQSHYPPEDFPNLSFLYQEAENLSLEEKFDNILIFNCFHWVRPWKKTLAHFKELLKPSGEILMLTYPKDSPYYEPFHKTVDDFPEFSEKSARATMFTASEFKDAFKQLNMSFNFFEVYSSTVTFESIDAMKDFTRIWLTSYIPLPDDLKEKFLDRLAENSLPYKVDKGDNKIHLPYQALFVNAAKGS